jgi:hypothetical protein
MKMNVCKSATKSRAQCVEAAAGLDKDFFNSFHVFFELFVYFFFGVYLSLSD